MLDGGSKISRPPDLTEKITTTADIPLFCWMKYDEMKHPNYDDNAILLKSTLSENFIKGTKGKYMFPNILD